jgi:hypothetical protein
MPTLKLPKTPPKQQARVDQPPTPHDAAIEARLKLPNERDEAVPATPANADPKIAQAAADVQHGLQDTSTANERNQTYRQLKK